MIQIHICYSMNNFVFCNMRASHCCGLSCGGAQAPDAQAQRPWLTGPAAPRHVGSSQTAARTHVPADAGETGLPWSGKIPHTAERLGP